MSDTDDHLHVSNRLRFRPASGEPIPTETVWFRDGDPPTARVALRWHVWERVAAERPFGLDTETVPTDLVPDVDVIVRLRFDPDGETTFPSTAERLRSRLADPDEPLLATKSWHATSVEQRGPLPEERETTDTVFASDDEPRAHVPTLEIGPDDTRPGERPAGEFDTGDQPTEEGADEGSAPHPPTLAGAPAANLSAPEATTAETATAGTDDGHLGEGPAAPTDPAVRAVAGTFDGLGWPYVVDEDGGLRLQATLGEATWDVAVVPTDRVGWCHLSSTVPRDTLDASATPTALLSYNAEVDRGGFVAGDEETVAFRTPVVPDDESVADAVGEHLTAVAEWIDATPAAPSGDDSDEESSAETVGSDAVETDEEPSAEAPEGDDDAGTDRDTDHDDES